MNYRTQSEYVDAIQWTGDNLEELKKFCLSTPDVWPMKTDKEVVLHIRGIKQVLCDNVWLVMHYGRGFRLLFDFEFKREFTAVKEGVNG